RGKLSMRSGRKEILRGVRSKYCILIWLIVLSGCYLQPVSVSAQPGSRPKIKTHPREAGARPIRRRVKKPEMPSEISLWVVSNPPLSKVFLNGEPRGETNPDGEL